MPYIPEEHKQYPVLPYCREHGGEVFQYHNLPEKELESLVGEHLIPYGYDSYEAYFEKIDGIVINPGGYTHTSVAIADAVKAIAPVPVVEVHISDIDEREDFRKISYTAPYCLAQIKGEGFDGYIHAVRLIAQR